MVTSKTLELKMMSSERVGHVSTSNICCLSPELQLETMNTSDMFDTGWDCSSGVDSGCSGMINSPASYSPEAGLAEGSFSVWDADHILQANLFEANIKDCFEDEMDLLSFANEFQVAGEDLSFLHDTTSNMSDASSSSSTITAYSVPQSPDHSSVISQDLSALDTSTSILFSSLSSNLLDSSSLSCVLPENFLNEETQENSGVCSNHSIHESEKKLKAKSEYEGLSGRRANRPKKHKKACRSPLTAASQMSSNSNMLSNCMPISPSCDQSPSPCQWYKVSSKENGVSPRKKKVFNILDSNIKWSELSSSEQWAVGEGLGVVLSHSLGVRERLELLNLLGSKSPADAPIITSEHDFISALNDEKLESIRCYLRGLDNEDTNSVSRLSSTSYGKGSQKCKKKKSFRKKEKLFYYSEKPKSLVGGTVDKKPKRNQYPSTHSDVSQSAELQGHDEVNPTSTTQWYSHKKSKKTMPQKYQGCKKEKKDLLHLRTRTRKEYRQLMKEKRSGLFEQEEVVCVSVSTCQGGDQQHDQDDDEDIDILG